MDSGTMVGKAAKDQEQLTWKGRWLLGYYGYRKWV